MDALAVFVIAVGLAGVVWARWLPRKMAAIRDAAIESGREQEFDARWATPKTKLALRVAEACSWLAIGFGLILLVLAA